jgi:hypothetical protein
MTEQDSSLISTHDRFTVFYTLEWKDEAVYTTRDFADLFKLEFRDVRYHLMRMVDDGLLCRVKYEGNTWYMKRCNYDDFKKLRPYIHLL